MPDKKVILKLGKDKAIKNHHHWIFSGAILSLPQFENGEVLDVFNTNNEFLGRAYFNKNSQIIGRMLTFDHTPVETALADNIKNAIALRRNFFDDKKTNAYRLINSEGDFIPGLIVDKYYNILVLQIGTLGIEKLKTQIIEILKKELKPAAIWEKSDLASRSEEGLRPFSGILAGQETEEVEILENGCKFKINLANSQKTGFFLDQRAMRQLIGEISAGRNVLNCFAYTGAFSVYAAKNKAKTVATVEISEQALELSKNNFKLNKLTLGPKYQFIKANIFEYLRDLKDYYDLIILDPPAFAKRKADVIQACRGYKDINRLAMLKIKTPGYLLTSSCSYFVDEKLFQQVIFQAAREAQKNVRIIQKHHLAFDHPINLYQPEGEYLKSLLLYLD